jgi:hypothetical protein
MSDKRNQDATANAVAVVTEDARTSAAASGACRSWTEG